MFFRGVPLMDEQVRRAIRFSSYTILTDRLPGGDYGILNGITGALDLIPDEYGDPLRAAFSDSKQRRQAAAVFEPARADALLRSLPADQIAEFLERGHVTDLSISEEGDLVADIAQAVHDKQALLPQFMIVPNLDCNYRCTYCFERPLQKGLRTLGSEITHASGNVVMTSRHITAAFRGIEQILTDLGRPLGGQIILYGGEPLDAANRDIVYEIVHEGIRRQFVFAVITNGHDLHEFLPLLGINKVEQVQISIDGPKQVHDRRRIHLGGESSFERILKNVPLALQVTDAEIQLRVHVDPANIHLFEETLGIFGREGWLNHPRVIIYANTVYEKDEFGNVRSRIGNTQIHAYLRQLTAAYSNVCTSAPAVHSRRAFERVFALGERLQVTGTYCAANTGNYIFAPDGYLYACWESIGKSCSRLGSYLPDAGVCLDDAAVQKWFQRSVAQIPECLTCAYALVCGGGCAQYAEYNQGTPFKPYCDDFQGVFSSTLAEQVADYAYYDSYIDSANVK